MITVRPNTNEIPRAMYRIRVGNSRGLSYDQYYYCNRNTISIYTAVSILKKFIAAKFTSIKKENIKSIVKARKLTYPGPHDVLATADFTSPKTRAIYQLSIIFIESFDINKIKTTEKEGE